MLHMQLRNAASIRRYFILLCMSLDIPSHVVQGREMVQMMERPNPTERRKDNGRAELK